MKENRTLTIGIIVVVATFSLIAFTLYISFSDSGSTAVPIEAIPIAEVKYGNSVYEIIPEESEARFILDELLRGVETTVVGSSNRMAGQLAFSSNNMYEAQVGTILIDAGSFVTNNNFRNNTLRRDVLFTHFYEFIIFEPTGLDELEVDTSVARGGGLTFTVSGELTIRDVTHPETFSVSATFAESGKQVTGIATTTIRRSDYELALPAALGVAAVDDEVRLEFDFTAVPVE